MDSNNKIGVEYNANPNPVPEKARSSDYGCRNCLWSCIECKSGSMYKAKSDKNVECSAYTYYDQFVNTQAEDIYKVIVNRRGTEQWNVNAT